MEIGELAKALSKAQSVLLGAEKKSKNPFFKSSYSDLTSCWDAIRKPLTDNGLSISQMCVSEDDKIGIRTILLHSSGQYIEDKFFFKPQKVDPQSMGSLISYMRRYSLKAVVGLADLDDDGEAAMPRDEKYTAPRNKTKKEQLTDATLRLYNKLVLGQKQEDRKKFAQTHMRIKSDMGELFHMEMDEIEDIRQHLEQMVKEAV